MITETSTFTLMKDGQMNIDAENFPQFVVALQNTLEPFVTGVSEDALFRLMNDAWDDGFTLTATTTYENDQVDTKFSVNEGESLLGALLIVADGLGQHMEQIKEAFTNQNSED